MKRNSEKLILVLLSVVILFQLLSSIKLSLLCILSLSLIKTGSVPVQYLFPSKNKLANVYFTSSIESVVLKHKPLAMHPRQHAVPNLFASRYPAKLIVGTIISAKTISNSYKKLCSSPYTFPCFTNVDGSDAHTTLLSGHFMSLNWLEEIAVYELSMQDLLETLGFFFVVLHSALKALSVFLLHVSKLSEVSSLNNFEWDGVGLSGETYKSMRTENRASKSARVALNSRQQIWTEFKKKDGITALNCIN